MKKAAKLLIIALLAMFTVSTVNAGPLTRHLAATESQGKESKKEKKKDKKDKKKKDKKKNKKHKK